VAQNTFTEDGDRGLPKGKKKKTAVELIQQISDSSEKIRAEFNRKWDLRAEKEDLA
jgi:hypothetical protein